MDESKSRKSDAAATRKRRSSILKSQRAPRAPFSELEFNVATPQDTAKSRRVSFSRRTGVAEFEINDATTAWKNVYEEHNKSLETSGNETGAARPRRVQHLGGRSADLFQDAEAELVGEELEVAAGRASLELSQLTEQRTAGVFRVALDVSRGATDRLDLDFSAVAPLADHDDLDVLQRDLDADRRTDISEYDIDVDFNATHFTLKGDDSDDMSITDSVRGPRVAAAAPLPDWTADKENIVVNPYVAPPPADFADDDCDDILVFDGKKCKFQSNLSDEDPVNPSGANQRKSIVNDTAGDISITRAVAERVLLPADGPPGLGVAPGPVGASNTVFFDDVADMTVTQALPAQILPQKPDLGLVSGDDECMLAGKETRLQTIVYGDEDADISVTQALPANIIAPIQIACDDSNIVPEPPESKTEKQKTMYFDDMVDISVTQTVPANIIQQGNNERDAVVKHTAPFSDEVAQPRTDRRTIVYGNDDGDLSVTGILPVNILDKEAKPNQANIVCRTTIVYENEDCNVSMTGVVPAKIMDRHGAKPAQPKNARRTTIVYDKDDGNISMTGVVPANIVVNRNEAKLAESVSTDRRKTIVYGNDDGNISMTGVVPANIVVHRNEAKFAESVSTDRRKTIVYGNDDGNISMTGVVPANIVVNRNEAKLAESVSTDRRKTIVYGNDDGNISMTGVVPANIVVHRNEAKLAESVSTDRRKTIVYGNDDGNISMTGVVPANIVVHRNEAKLAESVSTDRRKTIVYGNDDGHISMTGVVPADIMVNRDNDKPFLSVNSELRKSVLYANEVGHVSHPATDHRRTIVYGNDDANISMTGVVPANIIVQREAILPPTSSTDRRKTIVYGNDGGNISTTGVVPANIIEENDAKLPTTTERRKTVVFENNDGNISVTGVVPTNIMVDEEIANPAIHTTTERRKTVVFGNDDGNVSMTGVVPANIMVDNEAKLLESSSNERRKTIVYGNDDGEISMTGVVPDNIMVDKSQIQYTNTERRRTVIYGNDDGDVSTTGIVLASHVVAEKQEDGAELIQPATTERRRTVVYGNENGGVSMTGVVPAAIIVVDRVNQSQHANEERRTTVADDGNISMPGVVEAENCIAEEQGDKADLTQPAIERTKTIDYGIDDDSLSMTAVVPANVTVDKSGVNETQPVHIERRKTIVYENEDGDISMTGVVPADVIEKLDIATNKDHKKTDDENYGRNISMTGVVENPIRTARENEEAVEIITGTTDYRAEDGDVSMTEVEPFSNGALHTQTQPIETEDIISEDKNDQVSMSAVPRSPSEESHCDISVQASAVGRQSLANLTYGDLSHSKIMSTFHKSPGKVVVYEASTRDAELGRAQHQQDRSEGEAPSLASTRVSTTDVLSRKSDNFEAICAATLDAFSRSLAADRPSTTDARSERSTHDSTSMLDPLSRTRLNRTSVLDELSRSSGSDRMALDVSSRSLAPDRVATLEALSPRAALERAALSRSSPPVSVLDALLDMSSIDDELVPGPSDGPSRAESAATVARAGERDRVIVKDSDDEADHETTDVDDEEMRTSESTTPPKYEGNRGVGDSVRRFSEHEDRAVSREGSPKKEDARVETEDVERDEGNQTHWPSSCAGTQADDTRALLDALDRCAGELVPPRRSLAPDRRSMLRSREDLLRDISMAQALIRAESERSDYGESEDADADSDADPPRARFSSEVVKTLRFDDDSVRESPRVLHKPVAGEPESRRAAVIPPYLESVGEIKDLMEELVKPTADASPARPRPPARHSEVQTASLPSSQIDLVPASSPPSGPPAAAGSRTLSPLARLPAPRAVLVFDRHNPLNNVALPAPPARRPQAALACPSACPSLEQRAAQTDAPVESRVSWRDGSVSPEVSHVAVDTRVSPDVSHVAVDTRVTEDARVSHAAVDARVSPAVFAAHSMKCERAGSAGTEMEEEVPVVKHRSPQRVAFKLDSPGADDGPGAERGEARKRGYRPADPLVHELTPKPAGKVQKVSTASKVRRRRSVSPAARAAEPRAGSDVTVQQLVSEVQVSAWAARGGAAAAARSADDVRAAAGADLINTIAALPFMGTECSWESVSGDTWSFRLLRGRLRLAVRLAHGVQRARAHTPVVRAVVQHAGPERDSSDPVALWCARLAAEALQRLALNTRLAGALPATLRNCVALCRCALRWARAMHHARTQLAFSLDDTGLLQLKVANIPLRSVWEVSLRLELAEGGAGAAWPRAADLRVARVLAAWAPDRPQLDRLLQPLPQDWGHVPRAVWKIFKYLKYKRPEDDELLGT